MQTVFTSRLRDSRVREFPLTSSPLKREASAVLAPSACSEGRFVSEHAKPETSETKLLALIAMTFKKRGREDFKFSKPTGYQKVLRYLQDENKEFNPAIALELAFRKTKQGTVLERNKQAIQDTAKLILKEHFQQIAKTNVISVIDKLTRESIAKTADRVTNNDALLFGETHSSVVKEGGKLFNPATDWLIENMPNLWRQGYRNFVFELAQDVKVDDYVNQVSIFNTKPLEFIEAAQTLRDKLEKEVRKHNVADDPVVDIFFARVDKYLIEARKKLEAGTAIKVSNRTVKDNVYIRWQRIVKAARKEGFQVDFGDVKKKTRLERAILEYPFLDILEQLKQDSHLPCDTAGFKFLEFFLRNRSSKINQIRDVSLASTIRGGIKVGKTIALLGYNHATNMPYSGHYSTAQILKQGRYTVDRKNQPVPVTAVKLEFREENNGTPEELRFLSDFYDHIDITSPTIIATKDSPLLGQKALYGMNVFERNAGEGQYKVAPGKFGEDVCNAVITFPKVQAVEVYKF